ncbi:MAG: hypothetical protein C0423_14750 [Methylibium sp.]|nr:hypothetical protein [Methylibium sp.]
MRRHDHEADLLTKPAPPPRWASVAIPALIATAFALLLVFMLLSPVLLPALNLPTGADAEQADALRAAITHPFPPRGTAEAPAAQAIYTDFTRHRSMLLVYGVTDPAAQQQIVQQARQAQQRLEPSKPVEIRFLEHEVWVKDGSTGYRRGNEKLLHRELIR